MYTVKIISIIIKISGAYTFYAYKDLIIIIIFVVVVVFVVVIAAAAVVVFFVDVF